MRKYIFLFICLLILISCFYLNNNNFVFSSYQGFILDGDTIVKYNNSGGNVVIPSSIDGVVIKKIGSYAFSGKSITSVVIPNSIVEIGDYAFFNNSISTLEVPNSVLKIGEGAFMHNYIKNLSISFDVELGSACFNDNLLDISDSFFYSLSNSNELISYGGKLKGNITLPENVEIIGEKAFMDTGIISISLSNNISIIKDNAFSGNSLVEVYLSNNVKEISSTAFSNNNYLQEIVVDDYYNNILNAPWGSNYSSVFWTKK